MTFVIDVISDYKIWHFLYYLIAYYLSVRKCNIFSLTEAFSTAKLKMISVKSTLPFFVIATYVRYTRTIVLKLGAYAFILLRNLSHIGRTDAAHARHGGRTSNPGHCTL